MAGLRQEAAAGGALDKHSTRENGIDDEGFLMPLFSCHKMPYSNE
jgi:hypothetical protein